MKLYEDLNRNPTASDRIKFGFVFLGGLSAIAAYQYFAMHRLQAAETLVAIGAIVCALAFIPSVGRILYILWMGLGITIGLFTQPVFMAVAYVLLFIPLGLVFRAAGRDLMKRKIDRQTKSYWEDYRESADPASYFKQY